MNSVHDMGGMHGMGPIVREKDEPVFHARWEARIFAINRAVGAFRKWTLDASRYSREKIPAAEYLRMTYYERFIDGIVDLLGQSGLVTREEIASGKPARGSKKLTPAMTAAAVPALVAHGVPASRAVAAEPRFRVGDRVRAKNMHPIGHTRLPRYARGRTGSVARDHGVFVFPDTNAQLAGEKPQHVYSVRFAARELWGDQASPRDSVHLDLWDDYLDHV